MAKKLFAMEDAELEGGAVELEAAPEVGEVADAEVPVVEETTELEGQSESIDEGMAAADQMDQVEEVVASAAEGEGLEPVAAEAIKIAVEAICARIGANPKAVYSLYATENFQSASSRKANTKIALEGVGEFLKDLWKKIKAALQNLWAKVKAFWNKHVSTLGRIKKALDSMKQKVGASSGKLDGKAYIEEAPGGLASAFGHAGEISTKSIESIIAEHDKLAESSDAMVKRVEAMNSVAANKAATPSELKSQVDLKSTETGPLVGGVKFKVEVEADTDAGSVQVNFSEEPAESSDKVGVQLAAKDAVKSVLDKTLAVINENIKARDKLAKCEESFNKAAMQVEKVINESSVDKESAEKAKEIRKTMKIVYAMNAKAPTIFNKGLNYNIKLAKAVLTYSALCVKNYKSA